MSTKKNQEIIEYNVPIESFFEQNETANELKIRGIAINATTTSNGHTFLAEELEKSASTLRNKPILKDHNNSVDSIVGKTTQNVLYDAMNHNIPFEGIIKDEKMIALIKNNLLSTVSIGATVKEVEEGENGEMIVRGINFKELSLVAVPADEGATFAKAIAEKFEIQKFDEQPVLEVVDIKQEQVKEEIKMVEETPKIEVKEDETIKILNEKLEKLAEENKKLFAEIEESKKPKTKGVVVEQSEDKEENSDFILTEKDNIGRIGITPSTKFYSKYANLRR